MRMCVCIDCSDMIGLICFSILVNNVSFISGSRGPRSKKIIHNSQIDISNFKNETYIYIFCTKHTQREKLIKKKKKNIYLFISV